MKKVHNHFKKVIYYKILGLYFIIYFITGLFYEGIELYVGRALGLGLSGLGLGSA